MLIDKVCKHFDKDFDFFRELQQTNKIKRLEGCINNYGTINLTPENLLDQIKSIFDENIQNKEIIKGLRAENKMLRG